jgi:hypothetical protein
MADFQTEMTNTVNNFVAQISELARRAALGTLEAAFGGQGGRGAAMAPVAIGMPASGARVGRPRGGRGAKRTSADIEAMSQQVVSFVKANPGLRIEQINKALGTTTKDLALPIRKLVADHVLTSKGQKRSTTYFPGRRAPKN